VIGLRGSKELHGAREFPVGRDFLDTLGVPVVLGRGFREEDERDGANAVIVSERLVQDCSKGADPLGKRLEMGSEDLPGFGFGGGGRRRKHLAGKARVFEVVGVVRNIRDGLTFDPKDTPSMVYRPLRPADYSQAPLQGWTLMVRSLPGVDVLTQVRREIALLDDHIKPFNARSMPQQIDDLMFPVRMAVWTYGCIGVFGLILASVGLAGVTAYSVTQRRREIGIRIALGAQRSDVLHLVMKEGAVLILIGGIIGMAGARGGIRLLSSALSTVAQTAGTSTSDPTLLVGAPLLLATLALVACYVPARRSLRIDPAISLRQE
jgi:putative ABC transport system permease protein